MMWCMGLQRGTTVTIVMAMQKLRLTLGLTFTLIVIQVAHDTKEATID